MSLQQLLCHNQQELPLSIVMLVQEHPFCVLLPSEFCKKEQPLWVTKWCTKDRSCDLFLEMK